MTRKPYKTIIVVIAVLSVLLTLFSAVSVSYAKWINPKSSASVSVSVYIPETVKFTLTEEEISEIKSQLGNPDDKTLGGVVVDSGDSTEAKSFLGSGIIGDLASYLYKSCTVELKGNTGFYLIAGGDLITSDDSAENGGWTVNYDKECFEIVNGKFMAKQAGSYKITIYNQSKVGFLGNPSVTIEKQ